MKTFLQRKFVRDTVKLGVGKIAMTGFGAITAVAIYRLMGPVEFGIYGLAGSLVAMFAALDLTGIGISTNTRLAQAAGARDEGEVLNLLAAHIKIALSVALILVVLIALVGVPLSQTIHEADNAVKIGTFAFWLGIARIADVLYLVPYNALQSRRAMGAFALLGTLNQAALMMCSVVAALISQTAESLVIARLVYAFGTLTLAWMMYSRYRLSGDAIPYPSIPAILRRAWSLTFGEYRRRYFGYGVLIAFDKNLGNLYLQIPMQIAGALGGSAAAGYLDLAYSAISYASVITSALLDNLAAVVPQAIGRGEYARLWTNIRRILLALTGGGIAVFGAAALTAPIVVPLLFGEDWRPAIPALVVLMLYGVITTTGGIFGSLYRALNILGRAIAAKLIALVLIGVIAALWMASSTFDAISAAVIGAWLTVGFYAVSVPLTGWWSLMALKSKINRSM